MRPPATETCASVSERTDRKKYQDPDRKISAKKTKMSEILFLVEMKLVHVLAYGAYR